MGLVLTLHLLGGIKVNYELVSCLFLLGFLFSSLALLSLVLVPLPLFGFVLCVLLSLLLLLVLIKKVSLELLFSREEFIVVEVGPHLGLFLQIAEIGLPDKLFL